MSAVTSTQPRRGGNRRRHVAIVCGGVALICLLTALGALAGAARSQDKRAQAVVLVTPLVGNPFSPEGQGEDLVNMQSEAQLVRSDAVATLVARRDDVTANAEELLARVSVEVPPNTQILQVSYSADTTDAAALGAQSFATEYLRFRQDRAEALIAGRSSGVESRIETQSRDLRQLVLNRQDADSDRRRALLASRIDAAAGQISELRGQLAELSVGSRDPGQVVTPASGDSATGAGPLTLVGGAIGALVGLTLAVMAAMRWWGPRALRRPDDVERMGLPVLAMVKDEPSQAELDGDSVRELRAAVLREMRTDGQASIVLVAPLFGPAPRTANALATAMARSSVRTVLVDMGHLEGDPADGRRDDLASHHVTGSNETNLRVLSAGKHGLSTDFAVTPGLRRMLNDCAADADLVVVAGPSEAIAEGPALRGAHGLTLIEIGEAARAEPEAMSVVSRVVRPGESSVHVVWIDSRTGS